MSELLSIKERLVQSIEQLEYSVGMAREAIVNRFGEDHPASKRLYSYNEGIENQKRLVNELTKAVEEENLEMIPRLVSVINGISSMIKDDARILVLEMHTGKTCIPEGTVIN